MKDSIYSAIYAGFKDLVCFSDCRSLTDNLTGKTSVTGLEGILHDISMLSHSLSSISFVFIPRLKNVAADTLAKSALVVSVNSPLM